MSDRELRLRLQVRRHGLPEVNLLWNAPAGPDSTIAKLVEKVNEVLPLEGGDWGLEDYVVELKGPDGTAFECLHFQQVFKVLKDDDQVIVRSLLSDDLRLRRASGRHQITADGRHLVDGVAYGRRWLNAPRNRPLVKLPPRKRAKVEVPDDDFDDDEEEEENAENPLLLEYHSPGLGGASRRTSSVRFTADFDDADDVPEDDDFEPGYVDAEEPLSSGDDADHENRSEESGGEDDLAAELEALRNDFPPSDALEETPDHGSRLFVEKLRLATNGSKSRLRKRKAVEISSSSSSTSDSSTELTSDSEAEAPAVSEPVGGGSRLDKAASSSDSSTSLSSDESDDSDDSASSPTNIVTRSKRVQVSSSDSSSEESSEDESDDDGTVIRHTAQKAAVEIADDSSSSSSESSSSESESESDSEPEEVSSKPAIPHKIQFADSSTGLETADISLTNADPAPGQGMRKTQRRNLRRRLAKQYAAGTPTADDGQNQHDSTPDSSAAQQDEEFLARKKALLEMMEAGTPEKLRHVEKNEKAAAPNATVPTPYAPGSFPVATDEGSVRAASKQAEEEAQSPANEKEAEDPSPSTTARRLRLNVNAGRRMLFGALGLRNPKSKADEDKLRGDLMKNVRPHRNPCTEAEPTEVEAPAEPEAPEVEEDPDAWRQKINYRAVECVDEEVELSEPPFPFVQRWDPQQQGQPYGKKNGGKRKRNGGRQPEDEETPASTKKQKTTEDADYEESWVQAEDDTTFDNTVLTYDDPPSRFANESQFSDIDDLPSLPTNLAALTDLRLGDAQPGMVITWKHLLLSAQTNWQPEMVNVTAIVVKVEDADGKRLRLLLAKRDRALDQSEKVYDEYTGQRIYDRFEAPDVDEDEDEPEPDDGYRDIDFAELVEPKIIQQPVGSLEAAQAIASISDNVVAETQFSQTQLEVPTSAQARVDEQVSQTDAIPAEEPVEQQTRVEAALDNDTSMSSVESAAVAKSPSLVLGEDDTSKGQGRETKSPSRQVHETSKSSAGSEEAAEITVVEPTHDEEAQKSPVADGQEAEDVDGAQGVSQDSVNQAAGSVISESTSVPSGRQPDPHISLNLGNESPAPAINGTEDDISQDPAPAAEPSLETPRQTQADHATSSDASFPPLDEIWATATTSRANLSPSRTGVESALKGRGTTAPLEARFQLIEDMDDVSSPATARKQLFPNSTQPTKSSIKSPLSRKATQTFTPKKTTSSFVIPEGSQVVALSSDSPSPGGEQPLEESYAEDEVDGNYKSKRKAKVPSSAAKKTTRQSAKKEKATSVKPKQRANSTPRKTRRQSLPASYQKPKTKGGRRVTSTAWDGEI